MTKCASKIYFGLVADDPPKLPPSFTVTLNDKGLEVSGAPDQACLAFRCPR